MLNKNWWKGSIKEIKKEVKEDKPSNKQDVDNDKMYIKNLYRKVVRLFL